MQATLLKPCWQIGKIFYTRTPWNVNTEPVQQFHFTILSLRSVRFEARAPLHVCRLLRGPLQPSLLCSLPCLALAWCALLHLPQLSLCMDRWDLSFCQHFIYLFIAEFENVSLSAMFKFVFPLLILMSGMDLSWTQVIKSILLCFSTETTRWLYSSGPCTLQRSSWRQSSSSTTWGSSRQAPPPSRPTARSTPTTWAGGRTGGRCSGSAGTSRLSTPSSSRSCPTMGWSGTPRTPGGWRRPRTDEIRKTLAIWFKGPTIGGSTGSKYYHWGDKAQLWIIVTESSLLSTHNFLAYLFPFCAIIASSIIRSCANVPYSNSQFSALVPFIKSCLAY